MTLNEPGPREKRAFELPLVVAVTGHRDLVPAEIPLIRRRTGELFARLQASYPQRRLTLMSPLAEGADLVVAEVAEELQLDLWVPLPKARSAYLADFADPDARAAFERLSAQASRVFELSQEIPPAPEGFDPQAWQGSYPYAQLGVFLSAHCHILLAIWDGRPSSLLGGTAQVVRFHQEDVMEGFTSATVAGQQLQLDDTSDLVFHITCSRLSHGPDRKPPEEVVDWCWLTRLGDPPRSKTLPKQNELVFRRGLEFGRDAERFAQQIEQGRHPLADQQADSAVPAAAQDIDRIYCIADWLAIHYQGKTLRVLLVTYWMAFLMGMMFILYSDLDSSRVFLLAFLGFFAAATGVQLGAKRGGWQRKYLDYRTLAEGLRVQFYWAVAGVGVENKWKFAHDTYLQSQDPEFCWIRNVMRVAGIRCDANPNRDPAGVEWTVSHWVGTESSGQLGYYRRKAEDRTRKNRLTERLGQLSLATSVLTVLLFLVLGPGLDEPARTGLKLLMGSTLLLYAIREGYARAVGTKDLIKLYEFNQRIFDTARRRLAAARSLDEQRLVLQGLGLSALDENSDWTLMHRERSLDEREIWRMGS